MGTLGRSLAIACLLSCFLSCGTSSPEGVDAGNDIEDLVLEVESQEVAISNPDLVELASPEAIAPVDISVELEEADLPWQPGPGEPGYSCETGNDCNEGFCIQTGDGFQCTATCEEECPFDWQCVLHTPSSPDQVYICVPHFVDLCKPCLTNTECWTNGVDAGQACISYGAEGHFCGASCNEELECPSGYLCEERDDASGEPVSQCVVDAGVCPCKQWHIDEAAATDCFHSNDWGTCHGQRQCMAGGLAPCSAISPTPESCNSADDDCDGVVDEETGGDACFVTNQFGSCPGLEECLDGELVCQGLEPHAETCNGEDDDCDGLTDEGFEDTDGDGIADCLESDIDGDGLADVQDNCPADYNPTQQDNDLDNFGDACDADDDNDKVADKEDCSPFDDEVYPGADESCDGKDNNCNYIVDEGFDDSDSDGWKDCIDEDDDNDGSIDLLDCNPVDPLVNPSAQESCDGVDNDCDNTIDEGFPDTDQDGTADCFDDDADGDGVPDTVDNCPLISNEGQENLDKDLVGDACDSDLDGDSIPNAADNCPDTKNTQQSDIDKDGIGDDCDVDQDGDGTEDDTDNCPLVANENQLDSDGDGTGDVCEDDKDGDGSPDAQDCSPLDPTVHPGAVEVCDGVDNDCNLLLDDGFPDFDIDGQKDCVDLDDDGDGQPDETDCAPLNPAVHVEALEVCDGLDNNCSGEIDEELGKIFCGKGACAHAVAACAEGSVQMCDPFAGISVEVCDGVDNDCNGLADEGLGATSCGLGQCQHTVANCDNGQPVQCEPMAGAEAELCDGLDNDCDGKTDEDQATLACGKGSCFHTIQSCVGGVEQQCNPFAGAMPEVCDGADNDCNGETDEDFGTVSCGQGICLHEQPYCVDGKVTACEPFAGAQQEVCDGADNDCDGVVDEDMWPISCGFGVCYQALPGCLDGQVPECDPLAGAGDEECDGLDNDCDGQIDEGLGFATCGLGQCLHTVAVCHEGQPQQCDPMAGAVDEICDGLDNNCDGAVDPEDTDGCVEYFLDVDADNYGVAGSSICLCQPVAPYVATQDGDCDDENAAANPSKDEDCATKFDDDCSGKANEGCSYLSCKHALQEEPDAQSGDYQLDLDGEDGPLQPFAAYCDMETADGGWTLLMKTSGSSAYLYDNAVWTATEGGATESTDPAADEDYVSAAFYMLAGTESRLALGQQENWNSWNHAEKTARDLANQPRMAGSYGAASTCPAKTNCGTEPVNKRPLGIQQGTSSSSSNKWNRFGYVNDVNGWGTKTRVGFTGDNDSSDSSDSVMGIGLTCWNACLSGSCTGAPHGKGSGFYLYQSWAATPLDGAVRGWLWIR